MWPHVKDKRDKMWVILVTLHMVPSSRQDVVSLAQGMVRGQVRDGVVSYRGIPYATIDGESGRFKEAGVAPTWSGIRESQPSRCFQASELEDCLQLEVHVPSQGGPWPVLAWVRGGGGHYDPWRLVQSGITVVIISHRLNAPGFLCLGDESIPGNAGVKDVVHALRWVRDNVAAFKGSPHRVVVAGQGLGAAMTELLTLVPAARDLLHGAIAQSGSILCPWNFNYDAKDRAQSFMRIVEDHETSNITIVHIEHLAGYSDKLQYPYFPFGMCVESSLNQLDKLIVRSPYRLLTDEAAVKIPIMVGYNSNEAYVFVSNLRQSNVLGKLRDISKLLPPELQFINVAEKEDAAKQIRDLYFKRNHSITTLLSYYSDAYFVNHIYRSARLHARARRPVYFYQFSRCSELGVRPAGDVRKTGAAHSDELRYLFPSRGAEVDSSTGVFQQKLVLLWTNFVKYLDPTPNNELKMHWEPFDESDPRLLDVDTELQMKSFPHKHTSQIWDDIFQQFYYGRNVP